MTRVLGCLLAATMLASTGCTPAPSVSEIPEPSAAERYLAAPVQEGWARSVKHTTDAVVVFESPSRFVAHESWPYRFIVFNESGRRMVWDDSLFGFSATAEGAKWLEMRVGGDSGLRPAFRLALRSGESTTFDRAVALDDVPNPYHVTPFFMLESDVRMEWKMPVVIVAAR